MKMILEINNKGEAQEALNMLNTYLGYVLSAVAEVVAPVETVEKKQTTRTVKPKVEEKVEEVAPVVEEKVEEVAPVVEEKVEEVKSDFARPVETEGVTLAELKELGVKVRTAIGVAETKEIISKYAPTLSEVKQGDYELLATALKARL